ncbi:group II intron maturase-specific domain-containing protein [Streptomyces sp. NPDC029006]|uniref:group II intron maturase-specific domain-containing protein n=1 Tax=Streptomyces sp. NPDC029006 TaxID=3155467 RepID=UPI0033CB365A
MSPTWRPPSGSVLCPTQRDSRPAPPPVPQRTPPPRPLRSPDDRVPICRAAPPGPGLRPEDRRATRRPLPGLPLGRAGLLRPAPGSQFSVLDHYVWWITFRWARHKHPNKPKRWIVSRCYGEFNRFRNNRWIFGDRTSVTDRGEVTHLVMFSWTGIVRHQLIRAGASPDDRPGRVLDRAAAEGQTPIGRLQPAPARQAGWAVPALREAPSLRRAAATVSAGVGALVAELHSPGHSRQLSHPRPEHVGWKTITLVHTSCDRELQRRRRKVEASSNPAMPLGLA